MESEYCIKVKKNDPTDETYKSIYKYYIVSIYRNPSDILSQLSTARSLWATCYYGYNTDLYLYDNRENAV